MKAAASKDNRYVSFTLLLNYVEVGELEVPLLALSEGLLKALLQHALLLEVNAAREM